MAEPLDDRKHHRNKDLRARRELPDPKARFAAAIARSELGRFYWSDEDEAELREARKRKRKPKRQAAERYGVGVSTAIRLVQLFRKTGGVAPGKMGGHRRRSSPGLAGVDDRALPGGGLHPARLVDELGDGAQGRLPLGVGARHARS